MTSGALGDLSDRAATIRSGLPGCEKPPSNGFPPWDRVYAFFRRRRDHTLVKEFHDRLRARFREREGAGYGADG